MRCDTRGVPLDLADVNFASLRQLDILPASPGGESFNLQFAVRGIDQLGANAKSSAA